MPSNPVTSSTAAQPGRLGNPALTPRTDPRIDPRLLKALADFGFDGLLEVPAVTRADGLERVVESVADSHAAFCTFYEALPNDLPGDDDVTVTTRTTTVRGIDGNDIGLKIYRPESGDEVLPGVLYLHGGAMAILDTHSKVHDRWCRDIAAQGAVVILVDFRNAYTSEGLNPFPAGLNDCYSALLWADEHRAELGISKIVLHGESGGANLSLATTIKARREGRLDAIDGVYVAVPYISGGYAWDTERKLKELPSLVENDGYFMNCQAMDLFGTVYDPDGEHTENPLSWPYFVDSSELVGMPAHVIAVDELDPFRDEGIAYYRKLLAAGVPAHGRVNLGIVHGAASIFRQAIPDVYHSTIRDIHRFASTVRSRHERLTSA
ncbi:alpha/beta hydrolase fold domain-containing protein [Streptomyces sp. NPDC096311]|uniref:alpha/beta hydrolase fold domain-containing protein n=1 Tax=Streptomyces sp. NPDC096311 TaxID=3366083 RepID=UPI00381CEA77